MVSERADNAQSPRVTASAPHSLTRLLACRLAGCHAPRAPNYAASARDGGGTLSENVLHADTSSGQMLRRHSTWFLFTESSARATALVW